jgi:hypothetical protein
MRILLDESVPKGLGRLLEPHRVKTVAEQGWSSYSNGQLLTLASGQFDVLVTADQNLPSQQNLAKFDIAVVVLVAQTNQMVDYLPMADAIRNVVETVTKDEVRWVTA